MAGSSRSCAELGVDGQQGKEANTQAEEYEVKHASNSYAVTRVRIVRPLSNLDREDVPQV